MTRKMMKLVKQAKENAALLVRYANPKSKSKPTEEEVLEILYRHIPYCGTVRPIIKSFTVSRFNRNKIIKCAYFVVELDNSKAYEISAYQNLTGRTPEEKEADKTAVYPSGLFTIFHTEIKVPEKEPEPAAEEKVEEEKTEEVKIHGVYSLANCACVEVHIEEGYDPFIMWRLSIVDSEKPQKWHKAKIYDTAQGRQYFRYGKIKIYLDEVMRV